MGDHSTDFSNANDFFSSFFLDDGRARRSPVLAAPENSMPPLILTKTRFNHHRRVVALVLALLDPYGHADSKILS